MEDKLFFNNCLVVARPTEGFVETVFDDKTSVVSLPLKTASYKWTAKELGYTDLRKMCIDHEIIHTFIAETNGLPYSPSLWAIAHCIDLEYEQLKEEAVVLSFQKFINKNEIDPILEEVKFNKSIKKLRKEALSLLSFVDF